MDNKFYRRKREWVEKERMKGRNRFSYSDESDTSSAEDRRSRSRHHGSRKTSSSSSSSDNESDDAASSSSSYEYEWREAEPIIQPSVEVVEVGGSSLPGIKRGCRILIPLKSVLVILFPNNTPEDLEKGVSTLEIAVLTDREANSLTNVLKLWFEEGIKQLTVSGHTYVAEFVKGDKACTLRSLKMKYSQILDGVFRVARDICTLEPKKKIETENPNRRTLKRQGSENQMTWIENIIRPHSALKKQQQRSRKGSSSEKTENGNVCNAKEIVTNSVTDEVQKTSETTYLFPSATLLIVGSGSSSEVINCKEVVSSRKKVQERAPVRNSVVLHHLFTDNEEFESDRTEEENESKETPNKPDMSISPDPSEKSNHSHIHEEEMIDTWTSMLSAELLASRRRTSKIISTVKTPEVEVNFIPSPAHGKNSIRSSGSYDNLISNHVTSADIICPAVEERNKISNNHSDKDEQASPVKNPNRSSNKILDADKITFSVNTSSQPISIPNDANNYDPYPQSRDRRREVESKHISSNTSNKFISKGGGKESTVNHCTPYSSKSNCMSTTPSQFPINNKHSEAKKHDNQISSPNSRNRSGSSAGRSCDSSVGRLSTTNVHKKEISTVVEKSRKHTESSERRRQESDSNKSRRSRETHRRSPKSEKNRRRERSSDKQHRIKSQSPSNHSRDSSRIDEDSISNCRSQSPISTDSRHQHLSQRRGRDRSSSSEYCRRDGRNRFVRYFPENERRPMRRERKYMFCPDYSKLEYDIPTDLYSSLSSSEADFGDEDENNQLKNSKRRVLHTKSSLDDVRQRSMMSDNSVKLGNVDDCGIWQCNIRRVNETYDSHQRKIRSELTGKEANKALMWRRMRETDPNLSLQDFERIYESKNGRNSEISHSENGHENEKNARSSLGIQKMQSVIPLSNDIENLVVSIRRDCDKNRVIGRRISKRSTERNIDWTHRRNLRRKRSSSPIMYKERRRSHSPSCVRSFSPLSQRDGHNFIRNRRRSLSPVYHTGVYNYDRHERQHLQALGRMEILTKVRRDSPQQNSNHIPHMRPHNGKNVNRLYPRISPLKLRDIGATGLSTNVPGFVMNPTRNQAFQEFERIWADIDTGSDCSTLHNANALVSRHSIVKQDSNCSRLNVTATNMSNQASLQFAHAHSFRPVGHGNMNIRMPFLSRSAFQVPISGQPNTVWNGEITTPEITNDDQMVIILKDSGEPDKTEVGSVDNAWPFQPNYSSYESSNEDSCDGEVENLMFSRLTDLLKNKKQAENRRTMEQKASLVAGKPSEPNVGGIEKDNSGIFNQSSLLIQSNPEQSVEFLNQEVSVTRKSLDIQALKHNTNEQMTNKPTETVSELSPQELHMHTSNVVSLIANNYEVISTTKDNQNPSKPDIVSSVEEVDFVCLVESIENIAGKCDEDIAVDQSTVTVLQLHTTPEFSKNVPHLEAASNEKLESDISTNDHANHILLGDNSLKSDISIHATGGAQSSNPTTNDTAIIESNRSPSPKPIAAVKVNPPTVKDAKCWKKVLMRKAQNATNEIIQNKNSELSSSQKLQEPSQSNHVTISTAEVDQSAHMTGSQALIPENDCNNAKNDPTLSKKEKLQVQHVTNEMAKDVQKMTDEISSVFTQGQDLSITKLSTSEDRITQMLKDTVTTTSVVPHSPIVVEATTKFTSITPSTTSVFSGIIKSGQGKTFSSDKMFAITKPTSITITADSDNTKSTIVQRISSSLASRNTFRGPQIRNNSKTILNSQPVEVSQSQIVNKESPSSPSTQSKVSKEAASHLSPQKASSTTVPKSILLNPINTVSETKASTTNTTATLGSVVSTISSSATNCQSESFEGNPIENISNPEDIFDWDTDSETETRQNVPVQLSRYSEVSKVDEMHITRVLSTAALTPSSHSAKKKLATITQCLSKSSTDVVSNSPRESILHIPHSIHSVNEAKSTKKTTCIQVEDAANVPKSTTINSEEEPVSSCVLAEVIDSIFNHPNSSKSALKRKRGDLQKLKAKTPKPSKPPSGKPRGRPPRRGKATSGKGKDKRRKRLPSISSDEDIIEELQSSTAVDSKENNVELPPAKEPYSDSETEDSDDGLVSFIKIQEGEDEFPDNSTRPSGFDDDKLSGDERIPSSKMNWIGIKDENNNEENLERDSKASLESLDDTDDDDDEEPLQYNNESLDVKKIADDKVSINDLKQSVNDAGWESKEMKEFEDTCNKSTHYISLSHKDFANENIFTKLSKEMEADNQKMNEAFTTLDSSNTASQPSTLVTSANMAILKEGTVVEGVLKDAPKNKQDGAFSEKTASGIVGKAASEPLSLPKEDSSVSSTASNPQSRYLFAPSKHVGFNKADDTMPVQEAVGIPKVIQPNLLTPPSSPNSSDNTRCLSGISTAVTSAALIETDPNSKAAIGDQSRAPRNALTCDNTGVANAISHEEEKEPNTQVVKPSSTKFIPAPLVEVWRMPEGESCHGFLEVCMSAPCNKVYALRRIPYVKTTSNNSEQKCQDLQQAPAWNPNGFSNTPVKKQESDPHMTNTLPTSSACATYLRLRDVISLFKLQPEALWALAHRCEVKLSYSNKFTRKLFEIVYDPVCKTDFAMNKLTMRHKPGEHVQLFLDLMIILDEFLHNLLPKFYLEALAVPSFDVPKFVNVKIFKPIFNIDEEVIKIFRKPYEYNALLQGKDDKVKCRMLKKSKIFMPGDCKKPRKRSKQLGKVPRAKKTKSLEASYEESLNTSHSPTTNEIFSNPNFRPPPLGFHPQGFYLSPHVNLGPRATYSGFTHNIAAISQQNQYGVIQTVNNFQASTTNFPHSNQLNNTYVYPNSFPPRTQGNMPTPASNRQFTGSSIRFPPTYIHRPTRPSVIQSTEMGNTTIMSPPAGVQTYSLAPNTHTLPAVVNVLSNSRSHHMPNIVLTGPQVVNTNIATLPQLSIAVTRWDPSIQTSCPAQKEPIATDVSTTSGDFTITSVFSLKSTSTKATQKDNIDQYSDITEDSSDEDNEVPDNTTASLLTTKEFLMNASKVLKWKNRKEKLAGETGLVQKLRSRNNMIKSGLYEARDKVPEIPTTTNGEVKDAYDISSETQNVQLKGVLMDPKKHTKLLKNAHLATDIGPHLSGLSGVVSKLKSRVQGSMPGKTKRKGKNVASEKKKMKMKKA